MINEQESTYGLYINLEENINLFLNVIFKNNEILRVRRFYNKNIGKKFAIIYCDGMINNKTLNEDVILPIMLLDFANEDEGVFEQIKCCGTFVGDVKSNENIYEVIEGILYGDTLLLVDGHNKGMMLDTKGWETRSISEPQGETVLAGPREGFTESLMKNLSLIQRRIISQNLKIEFTKIGKKTNTKLAIIYLDGPCDKKIVEEVKSRISNIEIDGMMSTAEIVEFIEDSPKSLFRQIGRTERPDVVAGKLLDGKVAVMLDGTPMALTIPFLFNEYFLVNEDYYSHFTIASFNRVLRYLGFFLGSSVPAIYLAILTHHKEILPVQLVLAIFVSRSGVPLSTFLECIFMLIIFEIIKEAGIRLPKYIGPSISIVGGLVLGDAVVKARFVSSPMVIIIAVTELSGLILTYMQESLIILRIIYLILAKLFGLYGYIMGVIFTGIYLVSLKSFGHDYMEKYSESRKKGIEDTLIRFPIWDLIKKK